MQKSLPIGVDDFKGLIENNYYYVDKTWVIEELLTKQVMSTVLFPRPRRFGKSLFISMLENFFDVEKKEQNKNLFKGLYISKSGLYRKNLNRYPVIHLDFKDLKSKTFEDTLREFKVIMSEMYDNKSYVSDSLSTVERKKFEAILNEEGSFGDYIDSLSNMCKWLSKYYNEKVVILIDEYDTPIDASYNNNYYKKIMELIQPLFSKTFKGNDSLKLGVMTGVLRVGGESLFSSFNNAQIYDVMSEHYNEYFGFTENEAKRLLGYYGLKLTNEVKDFYDGYNFSGVHIYNPWSILNYARDKKLYTYWVNTGSNTLVKKLLSNITSDNKIKIEKLLLGENVTFSYEPKLSYGSLRDSSSFNSVLNLMLVSGYLTWDYSNESGDYFRVPNNEVKKDLGDIIEHIEFGGSVVRSDEVLNFIKGLEEHDKVLAEDSLNRLLGNVSYHDNKEAFYHGFVLSIFNSFLGDINYIVKSNEESGYGRPDVLVKKKDGSLGLVFELKIAKTIKVMENVARDGLKQLEEKNYKDLFAKERVKNIYEYVFVFHSKKVIIR